MNPAGKMSLTVYLAESMLASLIFGPWGLGLFQKLDLWAVMLIALAIWLLLVRASSWWLKRYAQGPFEWVMNHLTHSRADRNSQSTLQ
jgi:uncharacterized protein